MAKARNIVFQGEAYWARVYEGNHDEFGGKEFYKITVALNDESWAKYNKSGLKLQPKPVSSDDDTPGITFRRDLHAKTGTYKDKEYSIGGGAPRVVDKDKQEFSELIGNGSVVEVLVNVYDITKGPMKGKKGHRLEAIKVLEHIPYESMDFVDDPEEDEDDEAPFDTDNDVEEDVKEEVEEKKEPKKKAAKGLPF